MQQTSPARITRRLHRRNPIAVQKRDLPPHRNGISNRIGPQPALHWKPISKEAIRAFPIELPEGPRVLAFILKIAKQLQSNRSFLCFLESLFFYIKDLGWHRKRWEESNRKCHRKIFAFFFYCLFLLKSSQSAVSQTWQSHRNKKQP